MSLKKIVRYTKINIMFKCTMRLMSTPTGLECQNNSLLIEISPGSIRPVKIHHILQHMCPSNPCITWPLQFFKYLTWLILHKVITYRLRRCQYIISISGVYHHLLHRPAVVECADSVRAVVRVPVEAVCAREHYYLFVQRVYYDAPDNSDVIRGRVLF